MTAELRTTDAAGPTGLWLIGARGSVATTVIAGLAALRAGLVEATGCVTEQPPLNQAPTPAWEDITVGGHDITGTPLDKRAEQLADSGVIPHRVLTAVAGALAATEGELRHGYHPSTHHGSQQQAALRLAADIDQFRSRHRLRRVVVVNLASTEPPTPAVPEHDDLEALRAATADPAATVLPPSGVAAYAALQAGCPYVEFTPSLGLRCPALQELAHQQGLPYAGADGKTGETLLRTVLAPMFTERALTVRSWAGTNLLGGGDGANLADPATAASKLQSKSRGLAALLGGEVTAPLHIDNVPDLADTKVAWDHIAFEGFLGSRMSLQLTWNGQDSSLAAPLVLDLTRLVALAHAAGEQGPLHDLGFFFKDPLGSSAHRFDEQVSRLHQWAERTTARLDGSRR